MRARAPLRMSEAEFMDRPDELMLAELVDGEVVVTPSPIFEHQLRVGDLYLALRAWADRQAPPWRVALAPLDIRFGPGRILHPDLAVYDASVPRSAPLPLAHVPIVVVEVLSPSTQAYDRMAKRMMYARAGVAELWTVGERGVEVWSGAELAGWRQDELTLVSEALPGFRLDLSTLLRPVG